MYVPRDVHLDHADHFFFFLQDSFVDDLDFFLLFFWHLYVQPVVPHRDVQGAAGGSGHAGRLPRRHERNGRARLT